LTSISGIVQKESDEYEEYNNRFEKKGHLLKKGYKEQRREKNRKPGRHKHNLPNPPFLSPKTKTMNRCLPTKKPYEKEKHKSLASTLGNRSKA
jgi:hypothetical protein